jgi:hypothetical protein
MNCVNALRIESDILPLQLYYFVLKSNFVAMADKAESLTIHKKTNLLFFYEW